MTFASGIGIGIDMSTSLLHTSCSKLTLPTPSCAQMVSTPTQPKVDAAPALPSPTATEDTNGNGGASSLASTETTTTTAATNSAKATSRHDAESSEGDTATDAKKVKIGAPDAEDAGGKEDSQQQQQQQQQQTAENASASSSASANANANATASASAEKTLADAPTPCVEVRHSHTFFCRPLAIEKSSSSSLSLSLFLLSSKERCCLWNADSNAMPKFHHRRKVALWLCRLVLSPRTLTFGSARLVWCVGYSWTSPENSEDELWPCKCFCSAVHSTFSCIRA